MGWVALGLIAGFIVSKLLNLKGDDPKMGIGMAAGGAVVGGVLYSFFSGNAVSGFNVMSIMYAAIAAIVVLIAWHTMRKHSLSRH